MRWKVSVTRIATASRDIEVEADSLAEAEAKALEQASDEDFGGCVTEYAFETNGGTEVGDENALDRTDEPLPEVTVMADETTGEVNLTSEEKRCPDLGDGVCSVCCKTPFPGVSDETIDAGWFPSYFIGEDECEGPVCPNCMKQFMVEKDCETTLAVTGEYVSVWDGGVEVRAKCACDPRTRKISIEASQDANVKVLDREYVLLNGTEYEAANEDYRYEYTPEEQSRMLFWK